MKVRVVRQSELLITGVGGELWSPFFCERQESSTVAGDGPPPFERRLLREFGILFCADLFLTVTITERQFLRRMMRIIRFCRKSLVDIVHNCCALWIKPSVSTRFAKRVTKQIRAFFIKFFLTALYNGDIIQLNTKCCFIQPIYRYWYHILYVERYYMRLFNLYIGIETSQVLILYHWPSYSTYI